MGEGGRHGAGVEDQKEGSVTPHSGRMWFPLGGGAAGRARGPLQAGGRRWGFISKMLEGVFQKESLLIRSSVTV